MTSHSFTQVHLEPQLKLLYGGQHLTRILQFLLPRHQRLVLAVILVVLDLPILQVKTVLNTKHLMLLLDQLVLVARIQQEVH